MKKTYIMGILNVTPDSFSDGGENFNKFDGLNSTKKMIEEGADIIDIGAESSRPGHEKISEEEELNRILPVIKTLKENLDVKISIDTTKSNVARKSLQLGVCMINDIFGLQGDKDMAKVIGEFDAYVCIMHNRENTFYEKDIIESIKEFFDKSIKIALNNNIKKEKIVLDPGIGFGKTYEQNLEVLNRLNELTNLDYPILLGTSRKSVIGNTLLVEPKKRVEGTIATTVLGIKDGVSIFRVHDVYQNKMAIDMANKILNLR